MALGRRRGRRRGRALLRVVGPPYYALLRALDRDERLGGPRALRRAVPAVAGGGRLHPPDARPAPAATGSGRADESPPAVGFHRGGPVPRRLRDPGIPAARRRGAPSAIVRPARGSPSPCGWPEGGERGGRTLGGPRPRRRTARRAGPARRRPAGRPPGLRRGGGGRRGRADRGGPGAAFEAGAAGAGARRGRVPILSPPAEPVPAGRDAAAPSFAARRRRPAARLRPRHGSPGLPRLDDGGFVPESLPDESFRPLDQWVNYVLDREHRPLEAWVGSARFEFEPFVCGEGPKTTRNGARSAGVGAVRPRRTGQSRRRPCRWTRRRLRAASRPGEPRGAAGGGGRRAGRGRCAGSARWRGGSWRWRPRSTPRSAGRSGGRWLR